MTKPCNLIAVKLDTGYSNRLLIPVEDLAAFLNIIGKAQLLHESWDDADTRIEPEVPETAFSISYMSSVKYNMIREAEALGITYKEAKEASEDAT